MPVELTIVETVTELETTVVEVVLDSSSAPGIPGPGVPTGGTAGQVLTKDSGTDYDTSWQDSAGGGGGAPDDVDYLVGTASGDLSAEIVVGTSPGGELGGTWASPTVDATHSGSSHASVQAAAEATAAAALAAHSADTTSVHGIADTSVLATDSEVATAVSDHSADTISVHGIADTSALALTANHPSNATFNDHSARHEDGGADEISLTGLSGTSAALQAHLDDTADAHDASAISIADAGNDFTATDVEGALAELQADHEADATALSDHIADATAAHAATAIAFTPDGSIAATTVQAAIVEVRDEAGGVPTSRTLTAGAGLAGGGDLTTDRSFAVNVDDSSIEINSDTLRVKAGGIGANEIGANAIGTSELADNAVDTGAIADGAVTLAKLAAGLIRLTELFDSTLGSDSASIDTGAGGFSTSFAHLLIIGQVRTTEAVLLSSAGLRINNDSAGNYDVQNVHGRNTNTTTTDGQGNTIGNWIMPGASAAAGVSGAFLALIPNYAATVLEKALLSLSGFADEAAAGGDVSMRAHHWRNTAAITRLELVPGGGNLLAGTRFTVYALG